MLTILVFNQSNSRWFGAASRFQGAHPHLPCSLWKGVAIGNLGKNSFHNIILRIDKIVGFSIMNSSFLRIIPGWSEFAPDEFENSNKFEFKKEGIYDAETGDESKEILKGFSHYKRCIDR